MIASSGQIIFSVMETIVSVSHPRFPVTKNTLGDGQIVLFT